MEKIIGFLKSNSGLFWGIAAIFLWGLLAAFNRVLLEKLGMFTAGGCIYIAGGLVCFFLYPPKKCRFSLRYHGLCGACVILYFCLFSIGLGLAADRVQTVEMGLINYLWPLLTLLFSLIFFRKKAVWCLLFSGMALSIFGFAMSSSTLSGVSLTPGALWKNCCGNPLPYLMMTGAAISWALYSNILATVKRDVPLNGMPWFMVISGIILLLMRYPFHERSTWDLPVLGELLFMALLPIGGGYFCWDRAMVTPKRDSAILFSYLTPLFSAFGCAVMLSLRLPWRFYEACLLVISGALLCRYAIVLKEPHRPR